MAKTEISDYSENDADNTDISGIVLSDATFIDALDNIARAQMGALKRWFKSSLFRLRDSTDQTKLLAFDLSGLTTATTRTQKAPDYDGTLASQALGSAIASAGTTNIAAASGSTVHVTGTTTITALGTADAGIERTVIFDGILTLTHNATSLILPGAANITTAAGDTAVFVSEGSGNWRCTVYQKTDGFAPVIAGFKAFINLTGTGTPAATNSYNISSVTDNGSGDYTVNFTTGIGSTEYPFWITIADSYVASTNIRGWLLSSRTNTSLRLIFSVLSTSFGATPTDLNNIFIAVARGT